MATYLSPYTSFVMVNRRAPSWQLLFLSHPVRSAPPLLAWASFSASSYELQLTDLTQVWYEKLSKPRILERAAAENTAIDPSEAPENLATLLEYLQKAITKSVANVESELITAAVTDVGGADLRLKIKCELPGGLDDLIWTFELQHGTPVDFANMFVMPMLSRESLRADRIDSLLEKIAERDGVIERLVDYLQDQKTDPKVVVGHRRKKALQKFSQEEWEEEWEGMAGSMRPMEIVKNVFGDGKDISPPLVVQFGYDADQWWKRLDDTSSLRSSMNSRSMSRSFTKTITHTSNVSPARNDDSGVEDSFFTIRKTPPRDATYNPTGKKHSHRKSSPMVAERKRDISDTETDTEPDDDLDIAPPPQRKPSLGTGIQKIGAIGGKKIAVPPQSSSTLIERKKSSPSAASPADETMNDADQETDDSENEPAPPPHKKSTLGTIGEKRVIGRIGGGMSGTRLITSAGSSHSGGTPDSLPPPLKPSSPALIKRSLSPIKTKQPSPDLDPDERADLRRLQIEKELEAKRKATQKKRRKF